MRDPDFGWFQSDQLECYADAEKAWKSQWAGHPETGDRVRQLLESVIQSLEGLANAETEELREILSSWPELWNWSVDW